ncbi:hypothetical protein ACJ41O_002222 [Fusarium nematophilum]
MNPCAPTFIPNISSSETSLSGDESDSPPQSLSSREASRSARDVRSPRKALRSKDYRPIALDPDKYDTMFPSLQSANPAKDRPSQATQTKKRKSKQAKKGVNNSQEDEDAEEPSNPTTEDQVEEEAEEARETEEVADEPVMELLKPTVYTPPTSVRVAHRDRETDKQSTKRIPTITGMPINNSPSMRRQRPPTPLPESRTSRGRRPPRATTPALATRAPPRFVLPMAPMPPNPQSGPGLEGTPGPGIHIPVGFAPPFLSYPVVPMTMPPLTWPTPFPGASQMFPLPMGYGQPFPLWPYPPSVGGQGLQMQPNSRPGSRGSSRRSDSRSTSRSATRRGERHSYQASKSVNPARRPASATGLRTQVEMIKDQHRAKSSSPRTSRTNPDIAGFWLAPNAVDNDSHLFSPVAREQQADGSSEKELRGVSASSKSDGFIPTQQVQDSLDFAALAQDIKVSITDDQEQHQVKPSQPSHPPLNAPTGPSSKLRIPFPVNSVAQPSSSLAGSESGAWSQSKRWTSIATKERQAFQKMMANLRYMGAGQSPFVPQSPAELTAFKAAMAEAQRVRLAQEVERRLARVNAKSAENSDGKEALHLAKLLGGRQFPDRMSPFFAAPNCFNKDLPARVHLRVPWPSLAEFKEDGDKRAARQGRCLPLPRLNMVARRFALKASDVCNPDGTIRGDRKVVKVGTHCLRPVTEPEPSVTPPVELKVDEMPFLLRGMLHDIDEVEMGGHEAETEEEEEVGQNEDSS